MRKAAALCCTLPAAAMLAACGPSNDLDVKATGAETVPGTTRLHRFCDKTNLIYFSTIDNDRDQFEFIVPEGCAETHLPTPTTAPPTSGGGR